MGRHNKTEAYRTAGVTVLKLYMWVSVWVCLCVWRYFSIRHLHVEAKANAVLKVRRP